MAPVESPSEELRGLNIGGDSERKNNERKPRPDLSKALLDTMQQANRNWDDDPALFSMGDDLCAVCDDGGGVTCCDGGCLRSFHLSEKSKCRLILGLTPHLAKMITKMDEFICKNCKYRQHQCFACGSLGSSDLSSGAEVFQCEDDDCGHFYHPKCVAELLYPDSKFRSSFEQRVSAGEKFSCPVHRCSVCKGEEGKDSKNLRFAVCRRCPTTYHRKCLPSDIHFETKKGPDGYMRRAWGKWEGPDGTISRGRIMIYCMKHQIIEKLGTPKRNHIKFPDARKIRVPKMVVVPPMEEDVAEDEERLNHPSPEPSPVPPPAESDEDQCTCSSPIDSFAPKSLFTCPHPGSNGWLGD
ncbi:hypothetical protein ACP70R_019904 [Stipagrostis hirtigluma subsp. patula]